MNLNEGQLKLLRRLWVESGGKTFEPKLPRHPFFDLAIADGYVRRVDGRCGFERLRESMIAWTPAGRAALSAAGQPKVKP